MGLPCNYYSWVPFTAPHDDIAWLYQVSILVSLAAAQSRGQLQKKDVARRDDPKGGQPEYLSHPWTRHTKENWICTVTVGKG